MHQAILLPGAVLPAALAYAALREAIADDDVDVVAKTLEIYLMSEPPPGYSLDIEIEGVVRAADSAGFERFRLVGYSAGGAGATAFAARCGDRLHASRYWSRPGSALRARPLLGTRAEAPLDARQERAPC